MLDTDTEPWLLWQAKTRSGILAMKGAVALGEGDESICRFNQGGREFRDTPMKQIDRKSVFESVADELRQAILSGRLVPGDRIQQEQIAADLGVSRLPVRQAILILEAEGLIQTEHRRGSIVTPIDLDFLDQIYEFRGEVDSRVAAVLAARRDFDDAPLREIVNEALGILKSKEWESFGGRGLSQRFYAAYYEMTGNRVLAATMGPVLAHIHRGMFSILSFEGSSESHNMRRTNLLRWWENHAAILDAIVAGRVGRARSLARAHSRDVAQSVRKSLEANLAHLTAARRPHDSLSGNSPRLGSSGARSIVQAIERTLKPSSARAEGEIPKKKVMRRLARRST